MRLVTSVSVLAIHYAYSCTMYKETNHMAQATRLASGEIMLGLYNDYNIA